MEVILLLRLFALAYNITNMRKWVCWLLLWWLVHKMIKGWWRKLLNLPARSRFQIIQCCIQPYYFHILYTGTTECCQWILIPGSPIHTHTHTHTHTRPFFELVPIYGMFLASLSNICLLISKFLFVTSLQLRLIQLCCPRKVTCNISWQRDNSAVFWNQ